MGRLWHVMGIVASRPGHLVSGLDARHQLFLASFTDGRLRLLVGTSGRHIELANGAFILALSLAVMDERQEDRHRWLMVLWATIFSRALVVTVMVLNGGGTLVVVTR